MKRKRYLLDTDTFDCLIDGHHPEVRARAVRAKQLFISSITAAEIEFGVRKGNSKRLRALIDMFREMYPVVDWSVEMAGDYAEVRLGLERSGAPIGDLDMLTAAVARHGDYVLVTNNTAHFGRIRGLKVENWVK